MDELAFRLLGPMEITVAAAPTRLPGAAERALLAQLLLSPGRTIPATTLVDRLWAESSLPVDPMNALQVRVSKLRRSLAAIGAPDVVVREGVGYRAAVDPTCVDAVDFVTRLRAARAGGSLDKRDVGPDDLVAYDEALGLWRGEALSDFNTEPWAVAEAVRLSGLRLAAVTERAQIALALGRHQEVESDLAPMVSEDPTLESLAGLLMVALYRSSRQADALEVYSRTRIALDGELGLEPSTSLRSLHERVLRQDSSLGPQPDPSPPVVPASTQVVPASTPRLPEVGARGRVAASTNLPASARPLIGREQDLDAITEIVTGSRLVTLIGPGGAGKTSLAVAAAVRVAETFPDGAFEVRLSPVSSAEQVHLAFADALGVPLDGAAADSDVRRRLLAFLGPRRMLLLVDNCEHVIDAVAGLIDQIIGHCPASLCSPRAARRSPCPKNCRSRSARCRWRRRERGGAGVAVPGWPALRRAARLVRPGSVYGEEELLAVGRIARALDGIPLALELAAARVAALSPGEISERLEERFALLTSGARTAEARQQTLRATVDWSHALLTEQEQLVFRRLAVFRGGCTLAAAESVVSDDSISSGQVLDTVGRLVDRSMLLAEPGATTRYRLLETVRHYAWERLTACDEVETVAHRHAGYFRALAEETEVGVARPRPARGLPQAPRGPGERPHRPRAPRGSSGDRDAALTMAGSLGLFWHLGRHLEGREVLARLMAGEGGSPAARARALQAVSLVERPRACLVHPSPRCAETARESLELFEEVGDAPRAALSRVLLAVEGVIGRSVPQSEALLAEAEQEFTRHGDLWGQGVIGFVRMETALKRGDPEVAVPTGRSTVSLFRRLDDPWGLSATLYHLGWGLRQFGRYEECARVLEEAIDVASSSGLHNTVQWALADLGIAHLHLGDPGTAQDSFDRARAASADIGDGAGAVLADYGYGLLATSTGDWAEARRRMTAARSGFQGLGTPMPAALALAGLARCAEAEGDRAEARAGYEQVLAAGRSVGEPGLVASALEGLARLAATDGDDAGASTLATEAAQLRQSASRPAPPYERFEGWSGNSASDR